jgi:hypothetical protein
MIGGGPAGFYLPTLIVERETEDDDDLEKN